MDKLLLQTECAHKTAPNKLWSMGVYKCLRNVYHNRGVGGVLEAQQHPHLSLVTLIRAVSVFFQRWFKLQWKRGEGYGGYSGMGGMYGSGGYGGYSRYGMGMGMGGMGMGMGMGRMGMGMGIGGMDQQFSWLHSIQHFTSSMGYLTELLGMNTQAIGFFFGNLVGFLEHVGNSWTSLQAWREFPPGHPRHGEPPPSEEEERRRLSKLRVLRWAVTIILGYAAFRFSRAVHRVLTGHRPLQNRIPQSSMEDVFRSNQRGHTSALTAGSMQGQGEGYQARNNPPWGGSSGRPGQRSSNGGGVDFGAASFGESDPWSSF